jgi:hypothetical protein
MANKLPPETTTEITVKVSIRGDYCSENCKFLLCGEYILCGLFEGPLHNCEIGFKRCDSCRKMISSE